MAGENAAGWLKFLGPSACVGDPEESPGLAQLSSGSGGHLGSEPTEGRSVFPFFNPGFQIEIKTNKQNQLAL